MQPNRSICSVFLVERVIDGGRVVRKLPTEESAFMTFLAKNDLDRDPTRKVVGFS